MHLYMYIYINIEISKEKCLLLWQILKWFNTKKVENIKNNLIYITHPVFPIQFHSYDL